MAHRYGQLATKLFSRKVSSFREVADTGRALDLGLQKRTRDSFGPTRIGVHRGVDDSNGDLMGCVDLSVWLLAT